MPKGNRAEWTQLSCDDQVAAAPSYGRVAFIVRGEAFRLGGRNLDTSQAGGCKKQGAEPQREATQTLLNLMVSPLEARGKVPKAAQVCRSRHRLGLSPICLGLAWSSQAGQRVPAWLAGRDD